MVAGLVAVYVATDEAVDSDILILLVVLLGQVHSEQLVELAQELLLATHMVNYAKYIVRHVE